MGEKPYINIGEIVHDHHGSYITVHSGKIAKSDIDGIILRDTRVGSNADDNYVVDFGLNDDSPYCWISYNSKFSEDNVSVGRSHAVYTESTLETLYSFELLLSFPFSSSTESQRIVCGDMTLDGNRTIDENHFINKYLEFEKEFLLLLISYCLKKRQNGFKNFLYILVPEEVEQYQECCLYAIASIFRAIPVGLRKQFRIATNAVEENEGLYHILFCRESVYRKREDKGNFFVLFDTATPDFLKETKLNPSMTALLQSCVFAPQGTGNSSVDDCYENMEKFSKSIRDIRERDYTDFYEIKKLQNIEVTPQLLKDFDEKLVQNISSEQMGRLKKLIFSIFSSESVLETNIDKTETKEDVNSFKGMIALFSNYCNLIQYLQSCNVFFSEEYMFNKVQNIKEHFFTDYPVDARMDPILQELEMERAWKQLLQRNKAGFEVFFWKDALVPFQHECDENIAELEKTYKRNSLESWENDVLQNCSEDSISDYCRRIRRDYPDELSNFCDTLMKRISEKPTICSGEVVHCIQQLLRENPSGTVEVGLYEAVEQELLNDVANKLFVHKINSAFQMIEGWFGKDYFWLFASKTIQLVTSLFEQGINGEGFCKDMANKEILNLIQGLHKYFPGGEITDLTLMEEQGRKLIDRNLHRQIEMLASNREIFQDQLVTLWSNIEYFEQNNPKLKQVFKQEMGESLFQFMKNYSIRNDISTAMRKESIVMIWNFLVTKRIESPQMTRWFDTWKNESKKIERKQMIEKNADNFLSYFYACKNDSDIMDANMSEDLRKKIKAYYSWGKGKKMRPSFSVASFLDAIYVVEEKTFESLVNSTNPYDKERVSFYRAQFRILPGIHAIPIVITKNSDVSTIYKDVMGNILLSESNRSRIEIKFYDKKKIIKIEADSQTVLEVLEDLFFIKTKGVIETAHFANQGYEIEQTMWKILIDAGVLEERDILFLDKINQDRRYEVIDQILQYYESRKSNRMMKRIIRIACISVLCIIFLIVSFLLGVKLAQAKEIHTETEETYQEVSFESEGTEQSVPPKSEETNQDELPESEKTYQTELLESEEMNQESPLEV